MRAEQVVRAADVPLDEVDVRIPDGPVDERGLTTLAERWGIAAPIERLQDALAASVLRDDLTGVSAGRSRVSPRMIDALPPRRGRGG